MQFFLITSIVPIHAELRHIHYFNRSVFSFYVSRCPFYNSLAIFHILTIPLFPWPYSVVFPWPYSDNSHTIRESIADLVYINKLPKAKGNNSTVYSLLLLLKQLNNRGDLRRGVGTEKAVLDRYWVGEWIYYLREPYMNLLLVIDQFKNDNRL